MNSRSPASPVKPARPWPNPYECSTCEQSFGHALDCPDRPAAQVSRDV
jgi:hypothetical protein